MNTMKIAIETEFIRLDALLEALYDLIDVCSLERIGVFCSCYFFCCRC